MKQEQDLRKFSIAIQRLFFKRPKFGLSRGTYELNRFCCTIS